MTKRIWMPLYIADYLSDTAHLTTLQHGAYLLLIMHYWIKGKLPDNEDVIRRIARMDRRQWADHRDMMASLFESGWVHKRIDAELSKAIEKSKVNSANATKRHSEPPPKTERTHTQSQLHIQKEEIESCLVAPATQTKSKGKYSQEFEVNFWQPYPRTATMSKKQTWDAWQHLQPDQRQDACKAIQPYRDSLRGGEKFTVHACRFLSQRRFEGFVNGGVVATTSFDVRSVLV